MLLKFKKGTDYFNDWKKQVEQDFILYSNLQKNDENTNSRAGAVRVYEEMDRGGQGRKSKPSSNRKCKKYYWCELGRSSATVGILPTGAV